MKLNLKLIFVFFLFSQISYAGQEGNGGDAYSILWRQMAKQMQKELVMEVNKPTLQIRDVLPLEQFHQAIVFTDVESVNYELKDNLGAVRTAIFLSPEHLKKELRKEGVSELEIARRLRIHPYGAIRVQRTRFKEEMDLSMGASFHLIFHEYLRVMGIDDDNYQVSEPIFSKEYFDDLSQMASPTTKKLIQSYQEQTELSLAEARIQRIDKEIELTDLKIHEIASELDMIMDKRDEKIQRLRLAIEEEFNSLADLAEAMGFAPMPFGSYRSAVLRAFGKMYSAGVNTHQKLSEFEVIELQVRHLIRSFSSEMDWKEKIEAKRKERNWETF